jgi:hypothetical protein
LIFLRYYVIALEIDQYKHKDCNSSQLAHIEGLGSSAKGFILFLDNMHSKECKLYKCKDLGEFSSLLTYYCLEQCFTHGSHAKQIFIK